MKGVRYGRSTEAFPHFRLSCGATPQLFEAGNPKLGVACQRYDLLRMDYYLTYSTVGSKVSK